MNGWSGEDFETRFFLPMPGGLKTNLASMRRFRYFKKHIPDFPPQAFPLLICEYSFFGSATPSDSKFLLIM